jgi:hypothetical protein
MATGLRAEPSGDRTPAGTEGLLFCKTTRAPLGPTQPPVRWIPGFYEGVKLLGRDVDHSPSPSGEVKNEWSYTSNPAVCFHGLNRDRFSFTYYKAACVRVVDVGPCVRQS